jgi:quercetin dioxygenase-like cupin family protein
MSLQRSRAEIKPEREEADVVTSPLVLENRVTGDRLTIWRVPTADGSDILEMEAEVPPGGGTPLHLHRFVTEEVTVVSGVLNASVGGSRVTLRPGERATFPAGTPHRWWNEGPEVARLKNRATPAGDLDGFLRDLFVAATRNANGRPSPFEAIAVLRRYRGRHEPADIPRFLQPLVFALVLGAGRMLGRHPDAAV